jgi:predicted DNA binding CopG/RHH family protein
MLTRLLSHVEHHASTDSRPVKTLQDIALEAVREAEAAREVNYQRFLRGISNDLAFNGLPKALW